MSALTEAETTFRIPPVVKFVLCQALWTWADAHAHDVVLQKKVLMFRVTITVRDCERLIELLIGSRPTAPAAA